MLGANSTSYPSLRIAWAPAAKADSSTEPAGAMTPMRIPRASLAGLFTVTRVFHSPIFSTETAAELAVDNPRRIGTGFTASRKKVHFGKKTVNSQVNCH